MRYLILVAAVLAIGCHKDVTPEIYQDCERICADRGGLVGVMNFDEMHACGCEDGKRIHVNR
jgi:hypothetical protein